MSLEGSTYFFTDELTFKSEAKITKIEFYSRTLIVVYFLLQKANNAPKEYSPNFL